MSSDNVTETDPVAIPPQPTEAPGHRRMPPTRTLITLVVLVSILLGGVSLALRFVSGNLAITPPSKGPFSWSNSTRTTAPSGQYAIFAQQNDPVDPAFQAYYTRVNGPVLLGHALTPAYLTRIGWTQIFANGALVAPAVGGSAPASATPTTTVMDQLSSNLLHSGKVDSATGVVRIPLLDALLYVGSKIPLGGDDSAVTYVTVRDATATSQLAHLKTPQPAQTVDTGSGIFIKESTSHGVAAGHTIPPAIWSYITSDTVAKDGWQATFSTPLTEALATTATVNGAPHHLLIQVFALASVAVDLDQLDDQGQATGTVLPLGRDYLETLGPPPVIAPAAANAWLTGNTAIVSTPGGSDASAHLGQNFPLTLSGQTQWLNGMLWYEASWKSPSQSGNGWASADMVTMAAPAKDAPAWASFDALSPSIAAYLAHFGTNVSSVVYDITRNHYYTYNENTPFVLASSSKVSIMVSYLWWVESQGREPNAFEQSELVNMIEHSDNNAAQLLFDRLGGSSGQMAFYKRIGVTGYVPSSYGWGWAMLPPLGQMQVLTMLQQGTILTAKDRAYALNLMHNIESDQRMGVGETLPPGATVAMKDGWVPAPDGLWAINTSGIVTAGSETYIIVVYTAHQSDYNGAWNITRHVCKAVGQLLV